jgi:hypothetical protein
VSASKADRLMEGMIGGLRGVMQQAESAMARHAHAPASAGVYFIVGTMPEGATGARLVVHNAPPVVREPHSNAPRSLSFRGSAYGFPLVRGVAKEFRSRYIGDNARVVCRKLEDSSVVDELRAMDAEIATLEKRIDQIRDDRQALLVAAVPRCEIARERDCLVHVPAPTALTDDDEVES